MWSARLVVLVFACVASIYLWSAAAGGAPEPARRVQAGAGPVRYLVVGGGVAPDSTEVSLEQNVALAAQVLAGPGVLLFAGGSDSRSVRVLDHSVDPEALLQRIGRLFQPRSGRDSRYRAPVVEAAPADQAHVERELTRALKRGRQPLLMFLTTHGEQAEQARDNTALLWGGGVLTPARLSHLHDRHRRPLRLVATGCFSGGFAELAFQDGDAAKGPAAAPRCGLFAGPWDRETTGCDPDPERRNQEGYSLHFLNALSLRDRDGRALPIERLDLDGDARVSLLEAHTRARIESRSLDVPTTTSERYLRAVAPPPAGPEPDRLPEEAAVFERLAARLELRDPAAIAERFGRLDRALTRLEAELDEAELEAQQRYWPLSTRLLSRWPMLDDPYHPEFAPTLRREGEAIEQALNSWPQARAYQAAMRRLEALDGRYLELSLREAQVARLLRARETLELAAGLRRRGGREYAHYKALLACERYVPATHDSPGDAR